MITIEQWRQSFARLVDAIDRYEQDCWDTEPGGSFPDGLREALEEVAARRGGVEELVRTRPGCWEADHIRALAALADWTTVNEPPPGDQP
jgi:hypothetical protein